MKYFVLLVLGALTIGYLVLDIRRLAEIDETLAFADGIDVYPLPAEIDVNGDGAPGRLYAVPSRSAFTEAILVDEGREYLRFRYVDSGDTFRTSVGWIPDPAGGRLYVFDGSRGPSDILEAVYRFNGKDLVRVDPDPNDTEILNALSTQSMTGRGFGVAAYQVTRREIWFWLLAIDLIALVAVLIRSR